MHDGDHDDLVGIFVGLSYELGGLTPLICPDWDRCRIYQEADEIAIVGLTIRVSLFAGLDYWAAVRVELTN